MPASEDITFCVHCRNRLHQLKRTLPENLAIVRQYPGIGMTLVNYNSGDGLHEWAKSRLRIDISSGKLTYARETRSRIFHASKSKNLAHKLAKGRFLVNLDADNFIGETIPVILKYVSEVPRLVLQTWSGDLRDGTFGRIGMFRCDFLRLGGYDESLLPVGYQDIDLMLRAQSSGLPFINLLTNVTAIRNTKSQSLQHVGTAGARMTYLEMNARNMVRSHRNLKDGRVRANPAGWGKAALEINFERRVIL